MGVKLVGTLVSLRGLIATGYTMSVCLSHIRFCFIMLSLGIFLVHYPCQSLCHCLNLLIILGVGTLGADLSCPFIF
jgi:hypothetical protein